MTPNPESDSKQLAASYVETQSSLLSKLDLEAVDRAFQRLQRVRDEGATLFVAGNGGSAATASHWATDLGKTTKLSGRTPIRVMCLNDNTSWVTALANDEGYERVFAGQLENFAGRGDLLVVISASGNSPNLVRAVELAQQRQTTTIGFLGFDGGVLKGMVDDVVWVSTEQGAYGPVEDCHLTLCHILTSCLAQDGPEPSKG